MLVWLWILLSMSFADSISWSVETSAEEATIEIEILFADAVILRLFSTDNEESRALYSISDSSVERQLISGEIGNVWLASGPYSLRVWEGETVLEDREILATVDPPKVVMASTPIESTGVLAIRKEAGRLAGFSFAESINGAAFVPIDEDGEWRAVPFGGNHYSPEIMNTESLQWNQGKPTRQNRGQEAVYDWFIRGLLIPISIGLLGVGLWGMSRVVRIRENLIALLSCGLLGLWVIRGVLVSPGEALLMGEESYHDPPTSASLLAAIYDSLWKLSEISSTFNFPEGHSWLILGPNWLAYFVLTPLVLLVGPIAAQNIGIALACTLNAFCSWLFARELGIGKIASSIAAIGVVCSPVFLNEIDKLSLDRAFLFPIPLFFLCVRRVFREDKPLIWMIGAACSLAATFFFQVYYGLYLIAALPFLVLLRCFSAYRGRIGHFLVSIVFAVILIAPGLILLKNTTSGTLYDDSQSLWDSAQSIVQPLRTEQIQAYLQDYDPRTGAGSMHKDMSSPENRLLAVISNAIPVEQVLFPTKLFMGSGLYWFFVPLVLWLASDRRAVLRVYGDVFLLSLLSMGPFIKLEDVFYQIPLPYYLPHLLIPSFDQLKHPDRFAIIAVTISSIPLAFLLQGLFNIARKYRLIAWSSLYLGCTMLWLFVQPVPEKQAHKWLSVHIHRTGSIGMWLKATFGLKVNTISVTKLHQPKAFNIPRQEGWKMIAGEAALVVPVQSDLPVPVYINALQENVALVNDPPHGLDPQRQLVTWTEANVLLNSLLWYSGSSRLNNRLIGQVSKTDIEDLERHRLRHIVCQREYFISSRRLQETEKFLEKYFVQIYEDTSISVWELQ